MSTPKAMLPGSTGVDGRPLTLGVLGGGQLGRMFVHAAQTLGFATVVLDPDPGSPAGAASNHHVRAAYLDGSGLAEMVARCDALTTEFENVPAQALELLSAQRPVSPSAAAVSVCQHRAREKAHFVRAGVPCVPFTVVECEADLARVDPTLFPGILKSATLGYDGKGQMLAGDAGALRAAWRALREVPCVLEQRVRLRCELSVIVARSATGQLVHLPVQQNLHRDGILAVTQVPAPDVPAQTREPLPSHSSTSACCV
jgi:5-(carboxyamino)imidazole ribonucleotide synthase